MKARDDRPTRAHETKEAHRQRQRAGAAVPADDGRLAELIRAAAPRCNPPIGLETRILAQIALCDRRRRERRAVAAMGCYCLGAAAAAAAVAFVCLRTADSPEGVLQAAAIAGGVAAAMVIACGDRAAEILRRL